MEQFDKLVFIADKFDRQGLHKEANLVDIFLYKQGSVFSVFEKEALQSVIIALKELENFSLISTPGKSIELLGLNGRKQVLKGNVAEQYLTIYEYLDVFISEILKPNAESVPNNKYYQTLLEFTIYLKQTIESQQSRFLSVKNYYESFKADIEQLITGINSLVVNTNLDDEEIENIADYLDEIKQEYFTIISPLKEITKKGNINLTDFEGVMDNLQEETKQFLGMQGEEGNTLRSYLQNGTVVSKKKPIEERIHSFKWILENAKQAGNKAEKMAEQYKYLAELRREFQRKRIKNYTLLDTLLDSLLNRYKYWMKRYKEEGEEEYNVTSAVSKYNGIEEIEKTIRFVLDVYSPDKIEEALLKGLSKIAQDIDEIGQDFVGNEQVKEIERLLEKIYTTKESLERNSQKWDKSVLTSQKLYDNLTQEVTEAITSGRVRKDWDMFQKQVNALVKQSIKQFDLLSKNNNKIKEFIEPKMEAFINVINTLFK